MKCEILRYKVGTVSRLPVPFDAVDCDITGNTNVGVVEVLCAPYIKIISSGSSKITVKYKTTLHEVVDAYEVFGDKE